MGMFDTFKYHCPHCGNVISVQSKAGPCILENYDVSNVPPVVAGDLHKTTEYCKDCDRPSTIIVQQMISVYPSAIQQEDKDDYS